MLVKSHAKYLSAQAEQEVADRKQAIQERDEALGKAASQTNKKNTAQSV